MATAPETMLFVELGVSGCRAEAWLNDIPLGMCRPGLMAGGTWSAQSFVVDGENALQIVVEPGSEPASWRRPEEVPRSLPDARARARLVRYPVGAMTGSDQGEVLMVVEWVGGPVPQLFPAVVSTTRNLSSTSEPWAWQRAFPLNLERDRVRIHDVIRRVHSAFASGDGATLVDLAEIYLRDEARAYPVYSFEDLADSLSADVAENRGREGWVAPLNEDSYSLRLCADNRLVDCVDRNREPLIRTMPQPDGEIYPFPMFLGEIEGRIVIIR